MNIEEIRQRLVECDRAALEYQYSFTELLAQQQRLVGCKAFMLAQYPFPKEEEYNVQLIDEHLMLANEALEEIRRNIESYLTLRCKIARLLA